MKRSSLCSDWIDRSDLPIGATVQTVLGRAIMLRSIRSSTPTYPAEVALLRTDAGRPMNTAFEVGRARPRTTRIEWSGGTLSLVAPRVVRQLEVLSLGFGSVVRGAAIRASEKIENFFGSGRNQLPRSWSNT